MKSRIARNLSLWFGVTQRVSPASYAISGFALMTVKYAGESLLIWIHTSRWFAPWEFLNPLMSSRERYLAPAPEWVAWFIFGWTLPFLWVALSMSVRRAADAGSSPWLGMLVLVPLVNLIAMLGWCIVPSRVGEHWRVHARPASDERRIRSAALGVGAALMLGGIMLVVSVYGFASYGASLFLGTPLLMGAVGAYVDNRSSSRSYGAAAGLGIAVVFCGGLSLLLFALEGVICLVMAAPLMVPLGAMGGVLGKAIADATRTSHGQWLAAVAVLPLVAGVESVITQRKGHEYEVVTTVNIDAPPQRVWQHVISFPDLPDTPAWYFRLGIACPKAARIQGHGVGATRYCVFTTGSFVEPITAWDEYRRLAFDVTDQPDPMFELSPFRHVHPPHLDGYLLCRRGEFLLVALPGGRTRLEGRTWYQFDMFPQWHWTLWSDLVIHRIHQRVLLHVKRLSEDA